MACDFIINKKLFMQIERFDKQFPYAVKYRTVGYQLNRIKIFLDSILAWVKN
jgi:hypothetical protein